MLNALRPPSLFSTLSLAANKSLALALALGFKAAPPAPLRLTMLSNLDLNLVLTPPCCVPMTALNPTSSYELGRLLLAPP